MKAWCNHVEGAIVLLQLRGEEQLQTEIGRRLFVQLRIQIVCSMAWNVSWKLPLIPP